MEKVHLELAREHYQSLYQQYGVDEKSLGWTKNKQDIRFEQLMRYIEGESVSILDVGCGFGDLYRYLRETKKNKQIDYCGIDIMAPFIQEAQRRYAQETARFYHCSLSELKEETVYDWVVECGMFGTRITESEQEMYSYIEDTMQKSFQLARGGIAFYFLSDKVDYRTSDSDFHAKPEKVLEIAYRLSRRIILDNSIMPFEYCLTVWKDDAFRTETTVFNSYYTK